jgi:ABC-type Fe3+/spermidine/putrescine transport system ATPase subunit
VVREELRSEMRWLQRDNELSTVLVTHDPEEAAYLADELIVLSDGHVLQAGKREDVFASPASAEVARLIGYRNLQKGRVGEGGELVVGWERVFVPRGQCEGLAPGTQVIWSIRPEHVSVGRTGRFEAVVVDSIDLGASTSTVVDIGEVRLEARSTAHSDHPVGSRCRVDLPPESVHVWAAPEHGAESDRLEAST